MLRAFFVLLCLYGTSQAAIAQTGTKYWVVLKDKSGVHFDPHTYFHAKALERRLLQNLPLYDETDKPLNQRYVQQVQSLADSVTGQSRWLNAVACFAQPHQAEQLRKLPFVKEIIPMQPQSATLASAGDDFNTKLDAEQENRLFNQTASLGAALFREKQLDGKGIRVAVLDAGFKSLKTNPAFEHLRRENRIIKTWDFVKGRENVDGFSSHGTMVLSCIGGRL
ncbi:MAG TPA: hypothetical protein VK927_10635, partial [Adhaeribacter sp.]|nr:hypothetical protein [Adhaeribacter sp.]